MNGDTIAGSVRRIWKSWPSESCHLNQFYISLEDQAKLYFILFWCFHIMISKSLNQEHWLWIVYSLQGLLNKPRVMKQVQWSVLEKTPGFSLSMLNVPSVSVQHFDMGPSLNTNFCCREIDTSLTISNSLQFDLLWWWYHFQNLKEL